MGQLVFQATLGGQVNLVGPNTASTFNINVPAVAGTMVTTGDTGSVTNTMLASSAYTAPGTIGSGTPNTGAFTTLSASTSITTPFVTSAAATSLLLKSAGTTAVTIDTSQIATFASNVVSNGVVQALTTFQSSSAADVILNANGVNRDVIIKVNGVEQARFVGSTGNLGVGVTSPASKLDVSSASTGVVKFTSGKSGWLYADSAGIALSDTADFTKNGLYINNTSNYVAVYTGSTGAERARIDSSGNLLVGTTSNIVNGNARVQVVGTAGIRAQSTTSGETSVGAFATSTGATYYYIGYDMTAGAIKYQVLFNGNVQNTNNSYGAISDVKLKENIVDASPKLANLMQVKVRNYNLIGDTTKQIGVVAQELETVFPSMIEETADYEDVPTTDANGNETTARVATGTKTKAVKYSVFVPMLIKAIQELNAKFEEYKATHP